MINWRCQQKHLKYKRATRRRRRRTKKNEQQEQQDVKYNNDNNDDVFRYIWLRCEQQKKNCNIRMNGIYMSVCDCV